MGQIIQGKDFRKITFRQEGNWTRYAGGNAKQRAQKNQIPLIQKAIDDRRRQIGNK